MSHFQERKEKICLNCQAELAGRYCHVCGQENVEPRESLGHLIVHFFNDFTHFDGKFFRTVKLLLLRPGFLSAEYMAGRRAAYLNPIRMYLFTSAAFFFLFFSFFKDVLPDIELKERTGSGVSITRDSSGHTRGSMSLTQEVADSSDREYQPETIHAYDSLQSTLPAARRDGFVTRYVTRRMLLVNETYRRDKAGSLKRFSDAFVHSFPQMFFISLPAYALLLQLVYLRRRKTFYFVSHGIFGIHFYCAVFFFLFAILVLMELGMVGSILAFITFLCIPVFMYLSMKRFYRQGALKTFLKFAIVQILLSVVISALMILFVISSIFKLAA